MTLLHTFLLPLLAGLRRARRTLRRAGRLAPRLWLAVTGSFARLRRHREHQLRQAICLSLQAARSTQEREQVAIGAVVEVVTVAPGMLKAKVSCRSKRSPGKVERWFLVRLTSGWLARLRGRPTVELCRIGHGLLASSEIARGETLILGTQTARDLHLHLLRGASSYC